MSNYPEVQVPWGMVGPFLADAKKRVEAELTAIPGAKLKGIEITLYPKRGADAPMEEFNLTLGEIGQRFVPDDQIDDDSQQGFRSDMKTAAYGKTSFLDWLIAVLRALWLWFLRLLGLGKKEDSTDVPQDPNQASEPGDPVQTLLSDIREELAILPELEPFGVGVRALVERSPACITGLRCEWNLLRLGWYLRRYYLATTFLGGRTCKRSWTSTRC